MTGIASLATLVLAIAKGRKYSRRAIPLVLLEINAHGIMRLSELTGASNASEQAQIEADRTKRARKSNDFWLIVWVSVGSMSWCIFLISAAMAVKTIWGPFQQSVPESVPAEVNRPKVEFEDR